MSGFPRALPFVLEREGGYVNHPDDRGGATNMGVTQEAFNDWRRNHNLGTADVRHLTEQEAASVYHEAYWVEAHCDAWWWPLSLAVFDAAVQHGPPKAIRLLQGAVGTKVDGVVGKKTMGAVAHMERDEVLHRLRWERMRYYASIVRNDPSQAVFIVGWVNRMAELDDEVWADNSRGMAA